MAFVHPKSPPSAGRLRRRKAKSPMLRLFDSHCHLEDTAFDRDRPETLMRAREAGVAAMLIAGVDLERSRKALRIAQRHAGVFVAVGIHPHDASDCRPQTLNALKSLASDGRVRAWGEIGLDYNRMYSPRVDQESCFVSQLTAAAETGLPLVFHERDSEGRFLSLLRRHAPQPLRGVVHCFSGTAAELSHYLEMGLHIGVTGIVTLKKRGQALREMIPEIPLERLLIETDAPYLTPTPDRNRHRRNEPAFVRTVLMKLAEVCGRTPETLAAQTFANACELFGVAPVGPASTGAPP
jgi:TatD DNase family protein